MTASRTARLRHEQAGSDAMGATDPRAAVAGAWGELVDTLVGRLGADSVVRIEAVESHLPERAFKIRSVMEAPTRAGAAVPRPPPRPTVLFPKPEAAEAISLTPDGPVLELGWRGRRWDVIGCAGPERIAPEWWRWDAAQDRAQTRKAKGRRHDAPLAPPPPDREYFVVQTVEGRWLWVCRHAGTTRWFVHGEWT